MNFKKWILIILVPVIGFGGWFLYVNVNKYYSHPYPEMYGKLVDQSCEALIKNEDETLADKKGQMEFNLSGSPIVILRYQLLHIYEGEKYAINYSLTADREYRTEMGEKVLQESKTLKISISILGDMNNDTNQRVKITYLDTLGKSEVEYFNGANEDLYETFKQDIVSNLKSC